MAILTDINLISATEITQDISTKTITLNITGNLTEDGIDFLTLYQFVNDDNKIKKITNEIFELVNGWTFFEPSISLLRNGGFAIRNVSGDIIEEYACIITFGDIGEQQQVYYTIGDNTNQQFVNFPNTGNVNYCVKIFDLINNNKTDIKVFVRDYMNTYDMATLSDLGLSELSYQIYRFPLYTMNDLNIIHPKEDVLLYGVTITYSDSNILKNMNGNNYPFNIIIDGNGRDLNDIYESVQAKLTLNDDIDDGTTVVVGKIADELLYYSGEILTTKPGVFVENFNDDERNEIEFYDSNNILRTYSYIASGTFIFNDNLFTDPSAEYMLFYTDGWGTDSAIQVVDINGTPIMGSVTQSEISFTYDYDLDNNGGFASSDKNVTLVANGKNTGQFLKVNGTITRTKKNIFRMNAVKELSYKI